MQHTLHIEHLRDPQDAERAEKLLSELCEVLEAERRAVASFDLPTIASLGDDKVRLAGALSALAQDGAAKESGWRPGAESQRRLRDASQRAQVLARANSALLSDAISVISGRLGIATKTQSYDRRARRVTESRRTASKAI